MAVTYPGEIVIRSHREPTGVWRAEVDGTRFVGTGPSLIDAVESLTATLIFEAKRHAAELIRTGVLVQEDAG